MSPARPAPSLRSHLAWRVLLPLVLTWALGTAVALWVASHHVQQAYDRALLDDAHAVAAHVMLEQGELQLSLSPGELAALLFDQSERAYFAVRRLDGSLVAGQAGAPPALPLAEAGHAFNDDHVHGRAVRVVTLKRKPDDAFVVVMAQTTDARERLLRQLLTYSVAAQGALLLALAWWLRRTIDRQLRPLTRLQNAVDQRDADDLAPLPPALAAGAATRDLQRLGGSLNSLLERLARSLAAQREFSGNVAHELRTPLAGIRAQAEYALAQDDPALWRQQLEGILRSETRASHFVEQLLALARADEAQTALQLRPVDVAAIAREAVLRLLPRADALGVDLGATGLEQPVAVMGDAVLIEGALTNLLDNALRYGTAAAPRITVALTHEGGQVLLSVIDNGPGLPPAERERLLARGAQGKSGLAMGQGAGLGLAIVRRYAELLGAQFAVQAPPEGPGLVATLGWTVQRIQNI